MLGSEACQRFRSFAADLTVAYVGAGVSTNALQIQCQPGRQYIEFSRVINRQFFQNFPAFWRNLQQHLAQIARILRAQQESFAYGAIYQFYDAVMAQFESLRSVCNCYWRVLYRACNLKQKLMLLRLQTGCNRSFFAEMQKLSQLKAKLCETFQERTVIGRGWFDSHL